MMLWTVLGCPLLTANHLDDLRDFDRDGFESTAFGGLDCDDDDDTVFPAAPDPWYDGRIQDCNRTSDFDQDEDGVPVDIDCDDTDPAQVVPPEWFPDRDQDGFGDRDIVVRACEPPGPRWVDNGTDCDDTDPDITDSIRYYEDLDMDGFGNSERFVDRCMPPDGIGSSLLDGDCDDDDADQNPAAVWGWDADCDGHGDPATQVAQCDRPLPLTGTCPDGVTAANWVVGMLEDCDDTRDSVYPGAPGEVWKDGIDTDCAQDTDLDGPDANILTDVPSSVICPAGPPAVIRVPFDAADLQQAVDQANDCDVIVVGDVLVGNAVIDRPVAITAAPGASPVVVAEPFDEIGIEILQGVGVTLEGLTFQGFPKSVHMRINADLLAANLTFEGGHAIDAWASSRLELYDQTFLDTDVAVDHRGLGSKPFELHRCVVDGALALLDVVSLKSEGPSVVSHCTFRRSSSVQGVILRVDSPEFSLSDSVFEDNVGIMLDVSSKRLGQPGAQYILERVSLFDNVSVAPVLVSVTSDGTGVLAVRDLQVRDNVWDTPAGGVVLNLPESMVLFEDIEVEMFGAVFRGNVVTRLGPQLRVTGYQNLSGPVGGAFEVNAVEVAGNGGAGLEFDGGTLRNVTVVGFDVGIISRGPVILDSSMLAHNGDAVALVGTGDPNDPLPAVTASYTLFFNNAVNGPFLNLEGNHVNRKPNFLRYFPTLSAELWDLRLVPDNKAFPALASPCYDGGNTVGSGADPDGSDNDCGAFGGPFSDPTLVEDLDGDVMYDAWETEWLGSPSVDDGTLDPDGDGLATRVEFARGTLPNLADTDGDGVDDRDDECPLDPDQQTICVLPLPGF